MRYTRLIKQVFMEFDVGRKLKHFREYHKLTQAQMAEKANIDDKYYGRLERNESTPTVKVVEKICNGLDISLTQFFMPSSDSSKSDCFVEYNVQKVIAEGIEYNLDIHIERPKIIPGCSNCIWYNGYISTAYKNNYELRLYAEGPILAHVYVDSILTETISGTNVADRLLKYYKNDQCLNEALVKKDFNIKDLNSRNGNSLFVPKANHLTLSVFDSQSNKLQNTIKLDTDDIYVPFSNGGQYLRKYLSF